MYCFHSILRKEAAENPEKSSGYGLKLSIRSPPTDGLWSGRYCGEAPTFAPSSEQSGKYRLPKKDGGQPHGPHQP